MTKYHTYKRHEAVALLTQIVGKLPDGQTFSDLDSEKLYEILDSHNFLWDSDTQQWRLRKPGARGRTVKPQMAKHKVLLVRLMGPRELLTEQLDNFTLAMEVAGYEIIHISGPRETRGTTFYRVYLKLKVG